MILLYSIATYIILYTIIILIDRFKKEWSAVLPILAISALACAICIVISLLIFIHNQLIN